ncbi:hypothetical protein SAMN05428949_4508 [Chitinophaga sp. YR627]|uniref:hypothetical protein n=1 Tax=Chitinophaga sp. YR627 TaxID=1881041 RepID=UPI0008EDBEB1|nr:hypothetical protein [Chitinophaga sp. YR627]SFO21754.1 hypothetical protein SAMN05428949_4508 [Chitinophaga sp. YR627]
MRDNLDETSSIFDESFNAGLPVHRRELLHIFLRVFVWIGMVLSGLVTLLAVMNFFSFRDIAEGNPGYGTGYIVSMSVMCLIPGAILFLMTFPVWMGAKWAINLNVIMAVVWGFLLLSIVLTMGLPAVMLMIPSAIYLVPYWIFLFVIRDKWNK